MTKINTEEQILQAAEKVFHEKGYNGARMREIAAHAGINKGLLHYYFKSKDKLFEAIFNMAFSRMISKIQDILSKEISLFDKIDLVVDHYMNFILKNPAIPRFVVNELNKNPESFIAKHIDENKKKVFKDFQLTVEAEIKAENVKNIDARQLIMNLMSMIIFPFIGRPMMQVIFAADDKEFMLLLQLRKEHIKNFIKEAITK